MNYAWMDDYLLAKAGVVKDFKAEWGWDRFLLGGKLFAARCYGDDGRAVYITLKVEPTEGEFLRAQTADILPGYYMNKTHWISVRVDGAVPDALLRELLDRAYALVLAGFSKQKQAEILGR